MGQNSWNFYNVEDEGCIYIKKNTFKMALFGAHILVKSPGPVIDGFTNCFQW